MQSKFLFLQFYSRNILVSKNSTKPSIPKVVCYSHFVILYIYTVICSRFFSNAHLLFWFVNSTFFFSYIHYHTEEFTVHLKICLLFLLSLALIFIFSWLYYKPTSLSFSLSLSNSVFCCAYMYWYVHDLLGSFPTYISVIRGSSTTTTMSICRSDVHPIISMFW